MYQGRGIGNEHHLKTTMHLIDIIIRLEPREPGGDEISISVNPKDGTVIAGSKRLYPSEIELVHAVNELLKERKDHIQ